MARLYPPTEDGPQVAVEGIETRRAAGSCCSRTESLDLREANAVLSETGFRGVMRLDEVVRLDTIPVLGTGKTDYKRLRGLILEGTAGRRSVGAARSARGGYESATVPPRAEREEQVLVRYDRPKRFVRFRARRHGGGDSGHGREAAQPGCIACMESQEEQASSKRR